LLLNIDESMKASITSMTTTTRSRRQRLQARQAERVTFVFTFHGTATFQQEAAASVPSLHGHVITIVTVALSDPHAIQLAIKANPKMSANVLVGSIQVITSSPPTMPHGTSTIEDSKGNVKVSL
jgi:hypothetical protein